MANQERFDEHDRQAVEACTALLNAVEMDDHDGFNMLWDSLESFERGRSMYLVSGILLGLAQGMQFPKGRLQEILKEKFDE